MIRKEWKGRIAAAEDRIAAAAEEMSTWLWSHPEISDQEFLDRIYELRNTVFAEMDVQGLRKKGTSERYLSAEPAMAADLMYGKITLDEELDYGGGVEWYGNPF